MAVQLKFKVCVSKDCKKLVFSETTGAYATPNNEGGWGAPNEATSDATSATKLVVTDPSGASFTFNNLSSPVFFPTFPTTNSATEYNLLNTNLGLGAGAKITSGLWFFEYSVPTSTTTYRNSFYLGIYCEEECCIDKMLASIPEKGCDCEDIKVKETLFAFVMLEGLKSAACCGDKTKFNALLKSLQRICKTVDESCCNC